MRCQGVFLNGSWRCFYFEDKRNWRTCCDTADANMHLTAYIYHVQQKDLLAVANKAAARRGRVYGWRRWLRHTPSVPDALFAAYRRGRTKRW